MSAFPAEAVLKTVPLKFAGVEVRLQTSHGLFSSHQVDAGTLLLLKTLAQRGAVPEAGRVVDAGCGTGVLAVALKALRPALQVSGHDRLALASAFTAENARLNRLEVPTQAALLLEPLDPPDGPGVELLVCNIPAKAGDPVLAALARRSLAVLSGTGLAAVVIVETLASAWRAHLAAAQAQPVWEESGPGYRVFHYRRSGPAPGALPDPGLSAYRRGHMDWRVGAAALRTQTLYGLSGFDALDYRLEVSLPLLETLVPQGPVLVWEPGQGHLATWVRHHLGDGAELIAAGNDALGVAAAAHNGGAATARFVVPRVQDLPLGPGSVGTALVQFHPEPEIPWVPGTLEALLRLLAPGARVLVNGTSTDVGRFLTAHRGLRLRGDRRLRGWRAALLERQLGA